MNVFGPDDDPVLRSILKGLREDVWTTIVFSPRQAREDDVRARAMELEERESARAAANAADPSFRHASVTEADISPGS